LLDIATLQDVRWVMRGGQVFKATLPGTAVDP
jgi:hypothetical protein